MTRYLLTLPLILLLALCCVSTSPAQWIGHELPAPAVDLVGGSLEIHDWDQDGDLDLAGLLAGVFSDCNFIENRLPADWILYTADSLENVLGVTFSDTSDFDHDGDIDYVFYGYVASFGRSIAWIERLGELEFTYHLIATNLESGGPICAGDIDGDGDVDLVTMFGTDPDYQFILHTWWQQPDGSFEMQFFPEFGPLSFPSNLVDFNGDGLLEFVASRNNGLAVFSWTGDEWAYVMLDVLPTPYGYGYSYFDIDDFDGDGDLDFTTIRSWDPEFFMGEITWWEYQGGTTFARHEIYLPSSIYDPLAFGQPIRMLDADGDGDTDVAVCGYMFYNQGNGDSFVLQQYAFADNYPYMWDILEKADIDNDGDVDLFNEHIYWYENPTNDPPQFIIRLVPRQTIIPSAGGEVVFDGMIYNQFPQPMEGHLWADVTGPNGTRARVWHRRMTVTNGEWLTWPNLGMAVPGGLPAGDYRMTVRAAAGGYGFVPGDSLRFKVEGR